MTCDHCKTPIQKGEPYSLTEHGRLHASCLRVAQHPGVAVQGPLLPTRERTDPIFVLQRA